MADLRDFTGKNRKFTGAAGIKTSEDGLGAGDRVDEKGRLRFNDTTDLLEYYNGTDWKAIDAPPVITGFTVDDIGGTAVTSAVIDNEVAGDATIEVLGSLFDTTGANVTFVGSGETISTQTITRNSANKITVTVTRSNFDISNGPYTIKITNGSGLSAELAAALTADLDAPTFTNAADTNYDVFDSLRSSGTITAANLIEASPVVATSSAYAVTTGSLPSGFTLNTTSGDITWSSVSAVGSDTQTTFTITATSTEATATRQFRITVKAPVVTQYTSTGAFTFSVPTGVTAVSLLAVGGGGGGGGNIAGGGGAGGMVESSSYPVTPGGSVPGSVGSGGGGGQARNSTGQNGNNSVFGSVTATGGGAGGGGGSDPEGPRASHSGQDGGSGGGEGGYSGTDREFGDGTQASFPSVNATGYGNPGGSGRNDHASGGGGGAGGSGGSAPNGQQSGNGGVGRQNDILGPNHYWAGGGGGASYNNTPTSGSGGLGGGGGGGNNGSNAGSGGGSALNSGQGGLNNPTPYSGRGGGNGGTNTGGGAGGAPHEQQQGGTGGPGIVVVAF